jgi:hypothetical protein
LRLAVATTSLRGSVDVVLRTIFGEDGPSWFAVIAAGDVVAARNPRPTFIASRLTPWGATWTLVSSIEDSENVVKTAQGRWFAPPLGAKLLLKGTISALRRVFSPASVSRIVPAARSAACAWIGLTA